MSEVNDIISDSQNDTTNTALSDISYPESLLEHIMLKEGLTEADVWDKNEIKRPPVILPYEISTQVPGKKTALVFGNPYELAEILDYQQGFDNKYGAFGTCALNSISNIGKISGINLQETEVIDYAFKNNLSVNHENPIMKGDTSIKSHITILEHYGIKSHCEFNNTADCERLAEVIEGGHGVILGLNSGILQNRPWKAYNKEGKITATHSVCLTGTVRDTSTRELMGFYICDSSSQRHDGAKIFVSLKEMDACYMKAEGGFAIITDNPIRNSGKVKLNSIQPVISDSKITDTDNKINRVSDTQNKQIKNPLSETHSDVFKEFLSKKDNKDLEKLSDTNVLKNQVALFNELEKGRKNFEDIKSDYQNDLDKYDITGRFFGYVWAIGPNCYAFACNTNKNPITGKKFSRMPKPGELCGPHWNITDYRTIRHGSNEEIKDMLKSKWEQDCTAMGKELIEVSSADHKLQPGERLVSMLYTRRHPTTGIPDFHFMVREKSNYFLHKNGINEVSCKDDNLNYITDPAKCATPYETHLGYFIMRDKK